MWHEKEAAGAISLVAPLDRLGAIGVRCVYRWRTGHLDSLHHVRPGNVAGMINEKPHYGFAHVGGKLSLDFPTPFKKWIAKLAGTTGAEVVLFVADKAWLKTRQQEKGYHAMIQPLCAAKGWPIADLKRYFLAATFGVTKSLIDGKEILVEPHTSDLSKQQYSELIERTLEIAAEDFDTWLEAPSEWKARKEQERKQAARKQARAA